LERLVGQIEARIRATSQLVLRFSIPAGAASKTKQQLAEKFDSALSTWNESADSTDERRCFVVAYCARSKLYSVVKFLKSSGAAAIIVDRGEFIFEGSSLAFESFKQALKGRRAGAEAKSTAVP